MYTSLNTITGVHQGMPEMLCYRMFRSARDQMCNFGKHRICAFLAFRYRITGQVRKGGERQIYGFLVPHWKTVASSSNE